MHRADVIRYIEHNLDLPEEIHETIASYEGQPLRDLLVMAQAHASREVGDAFRQATEADLAVWNGPAAAVETTGPMVISADLSQAVDLANRRANDLYQTAYEDLASVNLRVLRQQGQGKPRLPAADQPRRVRAGSRHAANRTARPRRCEHECDVNS